MPPSQRIVCDCGGELKRPLPTHCPHCGGQIAGVRRQKWPLLLSVLLVAAMFASLAAFVWWLAAPP